MRWQSQEETAMSSWTISRVFRLLVFSVQQCYFAQSSVTFTTTYSNSRTWKEKTSLSFFSITQQLKISTTMPYIALSQLCLAPIYRNTSPRDFGCTCRQIDKMFGHKQKYSRLRCLLHVKGLMICFYLGWYANQNHGYLLKPTFIHPFCFVERAKFL